MARPRVFVSSTFYDLRQIRSDLEVFLKDMGYEPVLYERGHVPYERTAKLEESCYSEIEHCDILISVVGGRFGSPSARLPNSITQVELLTALRAGKQVYIFVEKGVFAEYRTYLANKGGPAIKYHFADNPAIYEFVEQCELLPSNNPIHPFESSQDIVTVLREQWAGLFQRFLQESGRKREASALAEMEATARTLKDLVEFLTEERRGSDRAVRDILLSNHPIFTRLRKLLNTKYRIYFTNRAELSEWLAARSYIPVEPLQWDDPEVEEWIEKTTKPTQKLLKIRRSVFDDNGDLRIVTPKDWKDDTVTLGVYDEGAEPALPGDDIPF